MLLQNRDWLFNIMAQPNRPWVFVLRLFSSSHFQVGVALAKGMPLLVFYLLIDSFLSGCRLLLRAVSCAAKH
jgi:hypothetical protein